MMVVARLQSIWARAGFLTVALSLSTIIIILNFAIGTIAPTTAFIDDEIWLTDLVWRVVQGQRVGIDYHDPLGFGLSEIGAVLWRSLGPHYFDNVLRLTQTVIGFPITWCGCLVCARAFNQSRLLAYVFCIALSLIVSAFSPLGDGWTIGMSMYFNHLVEGALAVLFLQTFVAKSDTGRIDKFEVVIAAFLLNILFLVKISGALIGLGIVFAGCLFFRPIKDGLKSVFAIFLLFVLMLVMDFVVTGLEVMPVLREYALAAQPRAMPLSPYFVARSLGAWASLGSITALLVFGLSQRSTDRSPGLWSIGLIVGTYTVTLLAFKQTSSSMPSLIIASAAAMVLTKGHQWSNAEAMFAWNALDWRRRFDPAELKRISVIDSIPYVISGLVVLPQIKASAIAFMAAMLVAFGVYTPIILGTGTALSWSALPWWSDDYVASVNDGVRALISLGATKLKIITLDFPNPFPALFQAPSPIGIRTWTYEFKPNAAEVLGDSCVVMVPLRPSMPSTTALFVDAAQSTLTNQFYLIYQDEYWRIYRQSPDQQKCVS